MANRMTLREFNAIKNQGFTLIAFLDGQRGITHSGLSLFNVVKELMMRNGRGMTFLIFPDGAKPTKENSFNVADFLAKYPTEIVESRDFLRNLVS